MTLSQVFCSLWIYCLHISQETLYLQHIEFSNTQVSYCLEKVTHMIYKYFTKR